MQKQNDLTKWHTNGDSNLGFLRWQWLFLCVHCKYLCTKAVFRRLSSNRTHELHTHLASNHIWLSVQNKATKKHTQKTKTNANNKYLSNDHFCDRSLTRKNFLSLLSLDGFHVIITTISSSFLFTRFLFCLYRMLISDHKTHCDMRVFGCWFNIHAFSDIVIVSDVSWWPRIFLFCSYEHGKVIFFIYALFCRIEYTFYGDLINRKLQLNQGSKNSLQYHVSCNRTDNRKTAFEL